SARRASFPSPSSSRPCSTDSPRGVSCLSSWRRSHPRDKGDGESSRPPLRRACVSGDSNLHAKGGDKSEGAPPARGGEAKTGGARARLAVRVLALLWSFRPMEPASAGAIPHGGAVLRGGTPPAAHVSPGSTGAIVTRS